MIKMPFPLLKLGRLGPKIDALNATPLRFLLLPLLWLLRNFCLAIPGKRKTLLIYSFTPKLKVIVPQDTTHGIFNEIFRSNVYESGDVKLERNNVVIDVGAHVGLFTLKSLHEGAAKVVSIEPDPDNLKLLKRNIKLYGAEDRVIVIPKAVGAREGKTMLIRDPSSTGGRFTTLHPSLYFYEKLSKTCTDVTEVELTTIDTILSEISTSNVSIFVKIDIEGAEIEALKGSETLLKRDKIKLAIAAYHYKDEYLEVIEFLKKRGFKVASQNGYVYALK